MNDGGKSDCPIVPENLSNKGDGAPSTAEGGEERGRAKGNPGRQNRHRTQCRDRLQQVLIRVRQAARKNRKEQFTALWHHVYDPDRLREAYFGLSRHSAPGVDGKTWQEYGENLEEDLVDLSGRLQRGAYRAKPVRRVTIPKPDGRQRLIGVPALEDKIAQRAAAEVMGAVYEEDFVGFSYGFRPGRGAHDALDAVNVGIERKKVNWVLDADIRGFFDAIDHDWLMKFVEHRIADRRVHRHVKKWLNAGVLADGKRISMERGTPQGGSISPLLANIYLHYVFDLWAHGWRNQEAKGDVIIVRYADDIVLGFQHRHEAEKFRRDMEARLGEFGLELNPDKTSLIEFGRFAAENREKRGDGKPGTFKFLGFTHICGKTRKGRFQVVLRRNMHSPVNEVCKWLGQVLSGYYRYFAVPGNLPSLQGFRHAVVVLWRRILRRRSHKATVPWRQYLPLTEQWLPRPRILHPYPSQRLRV